MDYDNHLHEADRGIRMSRLYLDLGHPLDALWSLAQVFTDLGDAKDYIDDQCDVLQQRRVSGLCGCPDYAQKLGTICNNCGKEI